MKYDLSRMEILRNRLDLNMEPTKPEGEQDAGVLILIHDDGTDFKVLLCVRSRQLRRHPGEVCFPGGMMDELDGGNVRLTAIREAEEEVGITNGDDYTILGNLPSFRARFGVLIHPTVALLRRPLRITMNIDEVESVFWISLLRFLDDLHHTAIPINDVYFLHMFQFGDAPTTFGVTALMCIVVAIGVYQMTPQYDLLANLTRDDMEEGMSSLQIIQHIYKHAGMKFIKSKI